MAIYHEAHEEREGITGNLTFLRALRVHRGFNNNIDFQFSFWLIGHDRL